ncbi:MAG: peptide-methionine (R)-S-oxide reductase MsrB [Pseudomonadota bacterium]
MQFDLTRRALLASAAGAAVTAGLPSFAASGSFEVTRTEAEWRAMLTPLQFKVMRREGTERAGSSPLDKVYDAGMYHCRGCDLPVYSSEHKYDSGTGWPSFWQAQADAIRTKEDRKLLRVRTECHCRRCGSHFGHIFNDGPKPTGKRHCLNGVSLVFKAA